MARPKRADAEVTRRKILESALALFGEHGVNGVSIRTIGAGAGVTLATVHHYFGSKDDLYEACIDTMYARMVALLPRLVGAMNQAAQSNDDRIEAIVREAFRFAREHQVQNRLLMRQVMSAGQLDEERRNRLQEPFLDQASTIIGAALGRDPVSLRLPLQTMTFAIARYAISTDTELELFTKTTGQCALEAVEDHLVRTAESLFSSRNHHASI